MRSITIANFKNYFIRDFDYGVSTDTIMDSDIQRAIDDASIVFNDDLYPVPTTGTDIGYSCLYNLTAYFLVNNLDTANFESQSKFLQTSRSVGGVSESLQIPDWIANSEFSIYATNQYGVKFLLLSKPFLDGTVLIATGWTQA